MLIVYLDSYTANPGDVIYGELLELGETKFYDFSTKKQGIERANKADILIVNKFIVDKEFLDFCPNLKYIVVSATGFNNVDLLGAKAKGIPVSNVINYSTDSVAQYVFASLFSIFNRTSHYFKEVAKGRWQKSRDFSFYDHSILNISNKSMGIVGFGKIGQKVAKISHAFGMKVFVANRSKIEADFVTQITTEELFSTADIITLHIPLNDSTKELINIHSLNSMKKNGILINTGRGGLINEEDLAVFLAANTQFKAILDVLSTEPPLLDQPLINLPNCYITPHIAWASQEARQMLIDGITFNIKSFLKGNIANRVN